MFAVTGSALDFPKKPVQFFIPFEVGQSSDIAARGLASSSEKLMGQPIVNVNKTGGGGALCFDYVKNAKPDGYNLGMMTASILTHTNLGRLPYDYKAWDYIARITVVPSTITVKASSPWKNLKEFIDYAKKNPGKVKVGNAGNGSFTHLIAVAFEEAADIKVLHVPIGVRRLPGLLGGEVDAISVHPPEVASLVRGGEMRILGIVYPQRMKEFPDVPTFKEMGYNIDLIQFYGIFAPKGTPKEIREYLSGIFKKATEQKEFKELAQKFTLDISYMAGDEFAKFIESQDATIKRLIEKSGMKK
jgi:tripartite-type tricarboxylate transporter receptor subunit TctC